MSKNALLFGRSPIFSTPFAWYKAYDNTHLTVNPDGTGGPPAPGGSFQRMTDLSGHGNHAGTVGVCIWRGNGFGTNFGIISSNSGSFQYPIVSRTGGNLNSQAFSGGMYMDCPGTGGQAFDLASGSGGGTKCTLQIAYGNYIYWSVGGGGLSETGPHTFPGSPSYFGRQSILTWRSTPAGMYIRTNGVQILTTFPAVASTTCDTMNLCRFNGGLPLPVRYYEILMYDYDIGQGGQNALEAYLTQQATSTAIGGAPDPTRYVVTRGDSTSAGFGSAIYKTAYDTAYMGSQFSGYTWYEFNVPGDGVASSHFSAADMATYKGSNDTVLIYWLGTNNFRIGQTAAFVEPLYSSDLTTMRNAGFNKIAVCTLQACVSGNSERLLFNTWLRANYTSFADVLVDLAAAPQLQDQTNTTYYDPDQIHLNDAGTAVAAPLLLAGLRSA